MRRYLREAWNDISNGENLDLYIIIPTALVIGILNFASSTLSAITLGILAMMAHSLLSNRKATNNLQSSTEDLKKATKNVQSSTNDLKAEIINEVKEATNNLQSSTEDLKKAINNGTLKIDQQDILYAELIKWIFQNKTPEKITFIQHSGVLLRDKILDPLMRLNTEIILYQQCDEIWDTLNLGGDTKDRISQIPRELSLREGKNRRDLKNCYKAHLHIKRFYSPASVRAVLVDSDVLIISWYVYSQDEQGRTNIKGSEYPGVMVFKETTEFNMLKLILETICEDLDKECLDQPEDYPGSQLIHIYEAKPHPPVNP
jgi:anti-sigma28 factor (negative regulator of flagellin synthesis)